MGECSVFLGIPYSQPPTNEGRFKPPRTHRGWQLLQAVDFGPACPQPVKYTGATKGIRDMDEDCLYLNIYTPKADAGTYYFYLTMCFLIAVHSLPSLDHLDTIVSMMFGDQINTGYD